MPDPHVQVPLEKLLVLDVAGIFHRGNGLAEIDALQGLEKEQTLRELQRLGVYRAFEVKQILEIVDEVILFEIASLSQI